MVLADSGRIAMHNTAVVDLVAPEMAGVVVTLRFPMFRSICCLFQDIAFSCLSILCAKHIILIAFWQCDEDGVIDRIPILLFPESWLCYTNGAFWGEKANRRVNRIASTGEAMSLEGEILGRYRLLKLIGSGGMGEVYLAQDPGISRQVAIKVVRVEAVDYTRRRIDTIPGMRAVTGGGSMALQDAARMFQREAKAIAMLDHPGILPLYDYGEHTLNGAILTYLVMPYREEGSLTNWLLKGGYKILTIQIVEQMMQQAAAALHYAHDHQVVHLDVKPSNFLIRSSREHPKSPDLLLTDFGIAKLSMLTTRASQSIRGTPTYMAPEQWEGRPVPATDQYALAVMLYELLTGQPPFRGTPMQMMYAHVNAQPQTPSSLNARLSSAIDTVVLRGLAKRPEERFPSIIAFAFAFRQALRSVDASIALGISHPETYTLGGSPITLGNNGLNASATLSISEEEARNGANRNITLPGGRQVRVRIPAGVKDRQVIRVLDQSEQTGGSSTVKVYLTLSIVPSAHNSAPLPMGERGVKDDVGVSIGREQKATLPTGSVTALQKERTPDGSKGTTATLRQDLHEAEGQSIGTPASDSFNASVTIGQITNAGLRRRVSTPYLAFIILLITLLVISSAGLFYYLGVRHSTSSTRGEVNELANISKTATANTKAHTTSAANAQKNATATAVAVHANPYPPYDGTLRLSDPMNDNNQGHHWQVLSGGNTGNSCEFVGSTYHLVETPQNQGVCFAANTDYTDFTYQIDMTFIRAGQSYDGGGIVVRGNGTNYYYFEVFESGRYILMSCTNNACNHRLVNGLSRAMPSFHKGLDQSNILAIEVKGFSFALFVNSMQVGGTVIDSNSISTHGMIGVFGAANDATTEVAYKDAKVWG